MRLAAIVLFAWSAFAGIERGDIAVVSHAGFLGFGSKYLTVYDSAGHIKFVFQDVSLAAFDGRGNLFAVANDGSRLLRFDHDFSLVQSAAVDHAPTLAVGEGGTVYLFGSQSMRVYSPDLVLQSRFTISIVAGTIDLAGDQCTLVTCSSFSTPRRFDVCNQRYLFDPFTTPTFSILRALGDGGYVAETPDGFAFVDPSGRESRLLRRPAPAAALAFDPDPQFLWMLTSTGLQMMDIISGKVVRTLPITGDSFAVAGETRPSTADILLKGRREAAHH